MALEGFLRDRGLCAGSLTATPIGDGHSNLTDLVSDGRTRVIVRRPPPPPVPPGANDVLREARIVAALAGTGVPVPEVLATAVAGEVVDSPFAVTSYVAGPVVTAATPPALASCRREIGESLVDTLAALHAVDRQAAGLGDLGRPEGFNLRHLRRIRGLVVDETAFAPVQAWLERNAPPESGVAILHNDYRLGNVILGAEPPGRVVAVLDWELATVGDPLFDVGYLLASYPEPGEPLVPTAALGAAVLEEGWPTRAELAARYAAATGRDLSGLAWYTVLALWKLAVLFDHSRRRGTDPYYDDPVLVRSFLDAAHHASVGLPSPGHGRPL
jgi:aminoglycoside phosphotransferase (APT) family kinase protein